MSSRSAANLPPSRLTHDAATAGRPIRDAFVTVTVALIGKLSQILCPNSFYSVNVFRLKYQFEEDTRDLAGPIQPFCPLW